MKKSFIIYLLVISSYFNNVFSQAEKDTINILYYTSQHKVKLGWSYNPFNRLYIGLKTISLNDYDKNNGFNTGFSGLYYVDKNFKRNVGSILVEYNRNKLKRLNIGIVAGIDIFKSSDIYQRNDTLFTIHGNTIAFSFMPNAYFHYLKHRLLDLYLGGEVGCLIIREKLTNEQTRTSVQEVGFLPTINFCPFGIQLKTVVSPYLQVNIGSRGWVEGGLVYNIK